MLGHTFDGFGNLHVGPSGGYGIGRHEHGMIRRDCNMSRRFVQGRRVLVGRFGDHARVRRHRNESINVTAQINLDNVPGLEGGLRRAKMRRTRSETPRRGGNP